MVQISGLEEIFINMCIRFARNFLYLPDKIDLYFEDCPSRRFPTLSNAAESDGHSIFLNYQWYHGHIAEHPANVAFFIFHELRHMHQLASIYRLEHGLSVQDPQNAIFEWKKDYFTYVRNEDEESQEKNIKQPIEVDADAYGICLMKMYYQHYLNKPEADLRVSLPESIIDLAHERAQEYADSKKELIAYTSQFLTKPNAAYKDSQKSTSVVSKKPKKKKNKRK